MDLRGQKIDHYRLEELLGQGGMGAVYKAWDEKVGRPVAVKLLFHQASGRPDLVRRFFNEITSVNLVKHPAILPVTDKGHTQWGQPYLVMELLQGETLSERVEKSSKRRLAERDVLEIAWQLASALEAIHARGIVHRDIKPSNVMLVADPLLSELGRVRLLDFGIAKLASGGPAEAADATRTGEMMGSPPYMPPEQWTGAGEADAKADIYSSGIMLYELLSGVLPFNGPNRIAFGQQHLSAQPESLTSRAPWVSPVLATLVHAMLAKKPADRPTIKEVVKILDDLRAMSLSGTADRRPSSGAGLAGSLSVAGTTRDRWSRLALVLSTLLVLFAIGLTILERLPRRANSAVVPVQGNAPSRPPKNVPGDMSFPEVPAVPSPAGKLAPPLRDNHGRTSQEKAATSAIKTVVRSKPLETVVPPQAMPKGLPIKASQPAPSRDQPSTPVAPTVRRPSIDWDKLPQ